MSRVRTQSGEPFHTYDQAAEAARYFEAFNGSGIIADHRTVRDWYHQYLELKGSLKPDGRGTYERELLVAEEDVNRKLTKWCLRGAKKDDLSIDSARDYLNNELLPSLPAATLIEYKIKLPISRSTTALWLKAVGVHRDKFKISYYNDR